MGHSAVVVSLRRTVQRGPALAQPDDVLVERVRAGDDGAFEAIYDRYARGVLAFCVHMLGSREEGEDALQLTFVSAYRGLRQSRSDIALRPWLYTIARNQCLSQLRVRRETVDADGVVTERHSNEGLADQVQRREDLREMVDDMRRLPEDQRAALVLFEMGDHSHKEIAAVLGVRAEKVKALIFQAREGLMRGRRARERPCVEIRELLSASDARVLPRSLARAHIERCSSCATFEHEVVRQRAALALILPVAVSGELKAAVLSSVLGGGGAAGAGTAAVSGGAAATAAVAGTPSVAIVASGITAVGAAAVGLSSVGATKLMATLLTAAAIATGGGFDANAGPSTSRHATSVGSSAPPKPGPASAGTSGSAGWLGGALPPTTHPVVGSGASPGSGAPMTVTAPARVTSPDLSPAAGSDAVAPGGSPSSQATPGDVSGTGSSPASAGPSDVAAGGPPSVPGQSGVAKGGPPSTPPGQPGAAHGGPPSTPPGQSGVANGSPSSSQPGQSGAAQGGSPPSQPSQSGAAQGGPPPGQSSQSGAAQGGQPSSPSGQSGAAQGGPPSSPANQSGAAHGPPPGTKP